MFVKENARTLRPLTRVLVVKIVCTALWWCIPSLISLRSVYAYLRIPIPQPMVFIRLLGAAYLALIVGYWAGLVQARRGVHPTGIVWMGAVSNGLASAILVTHGLSGAWVSWGPLGQVYMWGSAAVTLGITMGLLYYGRPWAQDDGLSGL